MTAEISILNKTAIVLAGDSAITIGDGKKIYNTANKIFKLTNKGTVGVMVYNQANWMSIPLETIIKSYNKFIKDTTFAYLEDYRDSFLNYLENNVYKYISPTSQEEIVNLKSYETIQLLAETSQDILQDDIEAQKIQKPANETIEKHEISKRMLRLVKFLIKEIKKEKNVLNQFLDYKLISFKNKYKRKIESIIDGYSKQENYSFLKEFKQEFVRLIFYDITSKLATHEEYSGVVIAGFGEDEIFPRILDFKLGELFENRLRIEFGEIGQIDNNTIAIIKPYAQRDMVDTFMQGIDPTLLGKLQNLIESEYKKNVIRISEKFKIDATSLNPIFQESINQIGKKLFEYRNKKHVDPVVTTVSYLNKEGLIELAESLVNITSLKRKTSSDLETVGGPVDIALITKGDGFKWIKTKANENIA